MREHKELREKKMSQLGIMEDVIVENVDQKASS